MKRFIVGELTRHWNRYHEEDPDKPLLSQEFAKMIEVNAGRGYELHSFSIAQHVPCEGHLSETLVAVFRLNDALYETLRDAEIARRLRDEVPEDWDIDKELKEAQEGRGVDQPASGSE